MSSRDGPRSSSSPRRRQPGDVARRDPRTRAATGARRRDPGREHATVRAGRRRTARLAEQRLAKRPDAWPASDDVDETASNCWRRVAARRRTDARHHRAAGGRCSGGSRRSVRIERYWRTMSGPPISSTSWSPASSRARASAGLMPETYVNESLTSSAGQGALVGEHHGRQRERARPPSAGPRGRASTRPTMQAPMPAEMALAGGLSVWIAAEHPLMEGFTADAHRVLHADVGAGRHSHRATSSWP